MVDVRPLLFANALALMLLVTAGFASVRDEQSLPDTLAPSPESTLSDLEARPGDSHALGSVFRDQTPQPVAAQPAPQPAVIAERFEIDPIDANAEQLAMAEPVGAMAKQTETRPQPAPSTGTLILRSNVVGDQVTINGESYGATRLDLELAPGRYDIAIEKPGHQRWTRSVELAAGEELTLVGELEAYTSVNYRNGEWLGGIRTGDGTWQDDNGLRYEGHFVDGQFEGSGTAWYPDGSRYQGDWKAGERHGEGTWRSADGSEYTGQFASNLFEGRGTLTLADGDVLAGTWVQGQLNGAGSLTTTDGMLYVGGFRGDEFHGQGALTYPDGRTYEGEFSNGEFHGNGAEVFADGKKYEGQYMEGQFHGKGLLRNPNGSSIEATFKYGEPYGQVRLTTAAGEVFTARTTEPGVCYREKSYRATQCPQLEGW
ncbi:MAG: PEGA domain-containing protein [Marinobacter sp. 34-60-7]|nr:MAG: PEGA domain-containing protein [Marinobacter sp. 34-60-7]